MSTTQSGKKILVIGGSGFIGQTLIPSLIKDGHDVTLLNRGNKPIEGAKQLIADRSNATEMEQAAGAADKYDVVIDTSSYSALHTNIAWTYFTNKTKQWIHLSSAAVYKETPGRYPNEKDETGGSSVWGQYGIDKSAADDFLIEHTGRIPVTIFRPPYIYGPGNSVDRETFIWSRVLQGRTIIIPTHGETVMQFIHVEDLVSAFVSAIDTIGQRTNDTVVYNVASDETPTQQEWTDIVAETTGVKYQTVLAGNKASAYSIRQYFPFRDSACCLDTGLIKQALSWQAKYNLREGLRQTYKSYEADAFKRKAIDTIAEDEILKSLS